VYSYVSVCFKAVFTCHVSLQCDYVTDGLLCSANDTTLTPRLGDRPGFDSRQELEFFSLRHRVQPGSGPTQPLIKLVPG
jgi:hypothetical protein